MKGFLMGQTSTKVLATEKRRAMIPPPKVDDVVLFGMVDRCLSEMKYVIDNPQAFDTATFQTLKHHLEDLDLFSRYATKKLTELGILKSLTPVAVQAERGY